MATESGTMSTADNDLRLVERARGGDPAAPGELFDRHRGRLWRMAAWIASSSSSGVALRAWPLSRRGCGVMPVMPRFL